jgi:hypothetical protein
MSGAEVIGEAFVRGRKLRLSPAPHTATPAETKRARSMPCTKAVRTELRSAVEWSLEATATPPKMLRHHSDGHKWRAPPLALLPDSEVGV